MSLSAAVLPDRTMAFPFAVVLAPVLWFVYRDATGVDRSVVSIPRLLAAVVAAVVVSYAVAVLVAAAVGPTSGLRSGWTRPLFAPSNATLGLVATVSVLLVAFLVADAVGVIPRWLVTAAAPFGMLVGWPVLAAIAATYAVGNALGTDLSFLAQAAFLVVGIVCTVAWWFVLSSRITAVAGAASAGSPSRAS